jgi:hypothetical protein
MSGSVAARCSGFIQRSTSTGLANNPKENRMSGSSFVRAAGQWLVVGALLGMAVGIKEAFFPTPFGTVQNVIMQGIVIVANTLVLVGVIGLARSGAAGDGWLARIGLGISVLASALFLPFEVLVAVNEDVGGALLGITALLQGLGLLLAGVAVLRAARWSHWHRFIPLLCGLYNVLVLIPVLALSNGYNAWALAGWQIPFLLLGVALTQQSTVSAVQPAAVR